MTKEEMLQAIFKYPELMKQSRINTNNEKKKRREEIAKLRYKIDQLDLDIREKNGADQYIEIKREISELEKKVTFLGIEDGFDVYSIGDIEVEYYENVWRAYELATKLMIGEDK